MLEVYGRCLVWVACSLAVFVLLDTFGRFSANTLPPVFAAAAFSAFYWYAAKVISASLRTVFGGTFTVVVVPIRGAAIALAAIWVVRSFLAQRTFVSEVGAPAAVKVDLRLAKRASSATHADGSVEVTFLNGTSVRVPSGSSLLEAAELAGFPISSGCRMGVCGADPVAVLAGFEGLWPIRREEADTLERLGLGGRNRMACVARVEVPSTVALEPDLTVEAVPSTLGIEPDPSVRRVVVIGNGIAGVTVADFVRRAHPDCQIDVIGDEAHRLYNRMAIARLINGRTGMRGLHLLPEDWYDRHGVACWLNTRVVAVDRVAQTVHLGTGEELPYDRLVLAMGARARVPPIHGFGLPGTFVLREASDAMKMRQHVQGLERRHAVVVGGGLLGLEAAYALAQLGMEVMVAERSDRLLRRSLDPTASEILRSHFEAYGIRIETGTVVRAVAGHGRAQEIETTDGLRMPCDVLLVAAGITPNASLASDAGIGVRRGVVVDEHMRTSDPRVYAVGDVAEFGAQVWGLWPVAVQQARVTATNIVGGNAVYEGERPAMLLKGAGIEMLSFGTIEAGDGELVIVERPEGGFRYRKVVLGDGVVRGGCSSALRTPR